MVAAHPGISTIEIVKHTLQSKAKDTISHRTLMEEDPAILEVDKPFPDDTGVDFTGLPLLALGARPSHLKMLPRDWTGHPAARATHHFHAHSCLMA
jgi:hypothetical protein